MSNEVHNTTPTTEQIERAALAWCGSLDRETFHDDVRYFCAMWRSFPGFRVLVEKEVANG